MVVENGSEVSVLILVVMVLGKLTSTPRKSGNSSLNPCCNGIGEIALGSDYARLQIVLILVVMVLGKLPRWPGCGLTTEGLNPCCNGIGEITPWW